MRNQSQFSIVASPILVGAVTVIVTVVAVFLSYSANVGLPFVPTYRVGVTVPDASGLVRGNEVRVGGKRVGIVRTIRPVANKHGRPVALLALQLDKAVEPIRDDTTVIVRPRSPLGLKYLEMAPGRHGREVPQNGSLPATAARTPVELTDVLNAVDAPARAHLRVVLRELGNGLAGRGGDFNLAVSDAPEALARLRSVAANVASRESNLRGFFDAADRTLAELDPVTHELGRVVTNGATTVTALADARPELGQVVDELPATEDASTRGLGAARPVLADADGLLRDLHRGSPYIVPAAARVHRALQRGIPALRHTTKLAGGLEDTLHAVRELSADPATNRTLERLLRTLQAATPLVDFIAPLQTKCNYISLWFRNVGSTVSEGDSNGTWFRTLVIGATDEFRASAKPAPNLHDNPYPHTAAPGQDGECEAGNEPYLDGQRIGNVPGNQGTTTEDPSK